MVTPQRRAVAGWCLYDWASSAFPTVVSTFVFAAYFTKGVATSETEGTYLWGNATAVAAVLSTCGVREGASPGQIGYAVRRKAVAGISAAFSCVL